MATVSPPLIFQPVYPYASGYMAQYIPAYIGEMSLTVGANVHPPLINQGTSVFAPVASFQVAPETATAPVDVFAPSAISSKITAPRITVGVVFAPRVGTFLTAPLITQATQAFAPAAHIASQVAPGRNTNTAQVFSPSAKISTTSRPPLNVSTAQVFDPDTIVQGQAALPHLIANVAVVFTPSIAALGLHPGLIAIAPGLYVPTLRLQVTPGRVGASVAYAPAISFVQAGPAGASRYDPMRQPSNPRTRVSGRNRSLIRRRPR